MSVPNSVDELLELVRKSGMIEDDKLSAYLCDHPPAAGQPAREFAEQMVRDALLTDFQKEQFLLGKWRGFTIGKYKLLERVGVGGMGQVFLCEHMRMKKRTAIKVLPPAKAEQPAALGRFYREARAAGLLEHPNIVRTHDIDQDGNLHFIVMEYVDGTNLLSLIKKFGPLDIGRAVYILRQVAVGLDFAFRNGIVHRDIKPGNILLDRWGTAKILDMGLARFYKDTSDLLTVQYDDKVVLGTADYVAPEQVVNSHGADVRADVYGLGATLYFLLAGHPPFPQGTVSQKLHWHRTKDPTPIQQIRPEVPEGLAAVVQTMMRKDPNQRYQTPAEVVAALDPWVPEFVQPPHPDEMPNLSPAARETAPPTDAEASSASSASHDGSGVLTTARGGSGAIGNQSSAVRHFPANAGVFGPQSSGVGMREAGGRPGVSSGLYKASPGPFAASPSDTPSPGSGPPLGKQSPYSLPAAAPAATGNAMKYVVVGLTIACAVMAVGLVYLGMMYAKVANQVAQ